MPISSGRLNFMTSIDEQDKLILFELFQDCRQSHLKIAKTLKIPRQSVDFRIKKMEDEGVIKKYAININYPKLGYSRHSIYLDLRTMAKSQEVNEYVKSITDIREVSCCYMLHSVSQWKMYVSVWTKDIKRYDEIQTKIITKFKKYLNNFLSFQSVESWTYWIAEMLNPKKKTKVDYKGSPENISLKDIDWRIIDKLRKNSTTPTGEIAKALKINALTVTRRIKWLVSNGIIERFYPIVDISKAGYKEYTFISRVDPSYSKELNKFIEFAKDDPRFGIIIKAVGYVNLYYAFYTQNNKEFDEVKAKVESILGKAVLENYRIEVEEMIS